MLKMIYWMIENFRYLTILLLGLIEFGAIGYYIRIGDLSDRVKIILSTILMFIWWIVLVILSAGKPL